MGFSAKQVQALRRALDHRYVRTREANGRELSYIEGWYAVSEANRIFGFDGWNRESVETRCVLAREKRGNFLAVYTAKVRVTVQARGIDRGPRRPRHRRRARHLSGRSPRHRPQGRRNRCHQARTRNLRQPVWARPLRKRTDQFPQAPALAGDPDARRKAPWHSSGRHDAHPAAITLLRPPRRPAGGPTSA